jgi:hypothetical protein
MDITRPLSVDPQFNPSNYIFRLFATLLENRIEFNAAANAAIDSSRRPISSRVLWRVRQSGSLEKIMLSVVVASAAQELRLQELRAPEVLARLEHDMEQDSGLRPALETEIFERLANDRRFSTLLLEEIERDKQWSDMSRKQFKSWTDWLKAFFEKLFDKKHPITRTAAALVVSGASVVASYNIALNILPRVVTDNLTVHIPIKPVAVETIIPVRLDLQGSPQSISIRVERPKTIDLQFAPRDPLKLNVIPTVLYSGASENRAANPGAKTPDCKPECPGLVSTAMPMEPLPVKVVGVPKPVEDFAAQTEQYWKQLDSLKEKIASVDALTSVVNLQLANYQATTTITVAERETGSVLLQWLGEHQVPASCELQVHVKKAGRQGSTVTFTPTLKQCSPPRDKDQPELQLEINQPRRVPYDLPFHVMATFVERHRFGRDQLQLRFQPDSMLPSPSHGTDTAQNLLPVGPD